MMSDLWYTSLLPMVDIMLSVSYGEREREREKEGGGEGDVEKEGEKEKVRSEIERESPKGDKERRKTLMEAKEEMINYP